ncbi:O-antigen ligase family protein [Candidatus Nomurabacteria bacterium]|uniref:O-antigen ligase family protein n=1 Tax=Candidatus Dojkabacteria bacterium TaxID=2099670 RepID=A0A955I5L6_9BACT|nr:O-antigen ligase family protein [Candidatus Dojkabacteria bacterium]MCB9789593.1 O-antigen ligase family protein [Candidatus Nomurabacteria bacterium]MCB9803913.1 O-antigen ligase family protein [Candidatus Nomurabacteria bacterium]
MGSYDLVKRVLVAGMISAGTLFVILGLSYGESRAVVLGIFCIAWVIIALRAHLFSASVLMLITSIPFNITYTIPYLLDNAYVNGIFVNYLAPSLSIIDLFAVLTVFTFLLTGNIKKEQKLLLSVLTGYLVFHTILFHDLTVIIQSFRWLAYITSSMAIFAWLRTDVGGQKISVGQSINKIYSIIKILLLLSTTQLILGIFQLIGGTSIGLGFIGESIVAAGRADSSSIALKGDLYLRAYGTFPHPNLYAGYAVFCIILSVGFIETISQTKWMSKFRQYFVSIALIITSILAVLISFSHAGYLVLLISCFVVVIGLFLRKRVSQKHKFSNASLMQLSTISPSLNTSDIDMKIPFLAKDRSIYERILLIESSIRYLGDHYLLGVGNGNFTKYFYEYAPVGISGLTMLQPVHNIFILIFVEHGIFFGGLLTLLFLGYMLISAIRTRLSLVYILVIVTILFIGNVDHYFLTLSQGLMVFFMILGLPYLYLWSSEEL